MDGTPLYGSPALLFTMQHHYCCQCVLTPSFMQVCTLINVCARARVCVCVQMCVCAYVCECNITVCSCVHACVVCCLLLIVQRKYLTLNCFGFIVYMCVSVSF